MHNNTYRIIGVESSPYSVKLRAVLRYRHIPHIWQCRFPPQLSELTEVKPLTAPILIYPDGTASTDSTPIIYDLEQRHPQNRSVMPEAPGIAFLSHLLEDFADEWLAKALFYYRFHTDEDGRYAAFWVQDDAQPDRDHEELVAAADVFHARQLDRLSLVGATEGNAPVLIETYQKVLSALEAEVGNERFLFGSRPALADFGFIGQLHTLSCDLTPGAIMRQSAPRTENWVRRGHDLSGIEGHWTDASTVSDTVYQLLQLASETYLPFLLANAQAFEQEHPEVRCELNGTSFSQPRFRYQLKCLRWLQEEFSRLPRKAHEFIDPLLHETNCATAFCGAR